MRNPHTVRLDGPQGSLMLTRRVSDLEFTNIENGGFGSGSFTLARPIARKQLETYAEVLVFDGRNGKQVGGGRILTPGRSSSDQGQVANISFLGEGPAALGGVERPYFLIDGDLSNWFITSRSGRRYDAGIGTLPDGSSDDDMLLFQATDGASINANDNLVMINRLAQRCGQLLGGLRFRHRSGITSSAWHIRGRVYSNDLSGFTTAINDDWSGSTSAVRRMTVNGDFSNRAVAGLQWLRDAAGTAGESAWSVARDIILRAQLYGTDGNLRTTGYTNDYVRAGEAFIDWCVRSCPTLDMVGAKVAAGTYQFDQLSWPDGIDGMAFMDELLALEKTLMWGVFEKQPNGLYRTQLIERSTAVRYELSVQDGYNESGPADELCNVVYALWTSPGGKPQMTRVPTTGVAPVPELDARGGHPQSKILTLGDEVGSSSQATKKAQEYLASHASIPNGGTLTVSGKRRIWDTYTGRMVAPWEIEPGYVGRIRGLSPRTDTLNPEGSPDGSTRARIVSMNWRDSRATAELQLDAYPLDQYHLIAKLQRNLQRRRAA